MLRDLSRDLELQEARIRSELEKLTDGIDLRLARGAESFTRLDERVSQATREAADAAGTADLAIRTAEKLGVPRPIPWVRVVPIIITLLAGFAAVVTAMARTPSRDDVEARARGLELDLRQVESRLVTLERELAATRAAADIQRAVLETVGAAVNRRVVVEGPRRK